MIKKLLLLAAFLAGLIPDSNMTVDGFKDYYNEVCAAEDCCPVTPAEAVEDIFTIIKPQGFISCSVMFDNMELMEEGSEDMLYFRATSPGTENISVMESVDGTTVITLYIISINDDLKTELVDTRITGDYPVTY